MKQFILGVLRALFALVGGRLGVPMQILWSLNGFLWVTGWPRLPAKRRFLRSTWEGIRRNRVVPARMVVALGGSLAASLVGAASPQEPAPQPEKPAEQVYKNIQVFKGLPNSRLLSAMFFMDGSLQVSCGHCHVWEDFSKDDKPAKRTARKMIRMVEQLNETQFEGKQLISCNTCHRGQSSPVAPLPFAKIEETAPGGPGSKGASTALPSAQELFAREVQAAGGEHATDNIRSRVMHGTRFSSEGWSSPVEIYQEAPDKWRDSFKLKAEFVNVFDGSHGWDQDNEGVHDINPAELKRLKLDADFYRNGKLGQRFLNARATGKEKVNGQDTYVVEAQTPEGDPRQLYFDIAGGLLLRIVRFDASPFGLIPNAVDYADYRELDGVQVPFTISHLRPDYSLMDRLTKIEQNVSIDPNTFNKPIMPEKP